MTRAKPILTATLGLSVGLSLALSACDIPECIDGPSNLTPEATQSCTAPPEDSTPETAIENAGAQLREDGTLVLTIGSIAFTCGTEAKDIPPVSDCAMDGWVFTFEIPPELAVPGVIALHDHPELLGTATVMSGLDGGQIGSLGDEAFWVGELELVDVGDDCVTGVLHGVGTGNPDPTLGGPELDGSFVAPRC